MNNYRTVIEELSSQYKNLKNDSLKAEKVGMPENAFFLENGNILTYPSDDGDARYVYGKNGFNFWAYSSGYMHSNDGLFSQFLKTVDGQEPKISFFVGIRSCSGTFDMISLLPVPMLNSAINQTAERFTVFSKACVFYITETKDLRFSVRAFPDEKNYMHFTVSVENLSDQHIQLYISAYLNPFLMHNFLENSENKWFREVRYNKDVKGGNLNSFIIKVNEDLNRTTSVANFGVVHRNIELGHKSTLLRHEATTSRYSYVGGIRGSIHNPTPLYKGAFVEGKPVCAFTEIGIIGDIIHLDIGSLDMARYDAELSCAQYCREQTELNELLSRKITIFEIDKKISELENDEKVSQGQLYCKIYDSYSNKVKEDVFNPFFEHLKKQVEFCSLIKGYVNLCAGSLIGIRDIFQAIEGLVFWKPEAARTKMLEALNFVFTDGRCPRQYSLPKDESSPPTMDLRPFIDQGVWVISTIITYLKATGNMGFLDEECGYYDIIDEKKGLVRKSELSDSVLMHMFKIMDYLLSNRDHENTGCIRALYGDWNDALDGLGVTNESGEEYGSGVSVMVSLQVYQNLKEMLDLLRTLGENSYLLYVSLYNEALNDLKNGLYEYAIIHGENNEKRIVHGWGDKRSYFVGSFKDPDNNSRHGLTSNAFWVLSSVYDTDISIKQTILDAFKALDSKYGFKTFEPYFPSNTPGVGRIPKLPAGTAENGSSYTHASTFAVMALYRMGCPREAWEQLIKLLPFTHNKLTCSPFVMPNSYGYNEDLLIDGESMQDWQTGSSNVLFKTLIKYVFGVEPQFKGVWIQPAGWIPFKKYEFGVRIKDCKLKINYEDTGERERKYFINGIQHKGVLDEIMGIKRLWISDEELKAVRINIIVKD